MIFNETLQRLIGRNFDMDSGVGTLGIRVLSVWFIPSGMHPFRKASFTILVTEGPTTPPLFE